MGELETRVEEKVPTKSELKAVENGLGERIERAEKRILVIGVPVVVWEPLTCADRLGSAKKVGR